MLVYSVASLPSFEMVQVIRDKILDRLVSRALICLAAISGTVTQGRTMELS